MNGSQYGESIVPLRLIVMKKQKKPIFLILVLAGAFISVAVMNRPSKDLNDQKTPPPEATEKKDDVAKGVSDIMKTTPKVGTAGNNAHRGGKPGSDIPSILKIEEKPYKPKPNESSTSAQWYRPESARNQPTK